MVPVKDSTGNPMKPQKSGAKQEHGVRQKKCYHNKVSLTMDSIGYKVNNNSKTCKMGRNVLGMKTLQEILQILDSLNAEVSFLQLVFAFL